MGDVAHNYPESCAKNKRKECARGAGKKEFYVPETGVSVEIAETRRWRPPPGGCATPRGVRRRSPKYSPLCAEITIATGYKS